MTKSADNTSRDVRGTISFDDTYRRLTIYCQLNLHDKVNNVVADIPMIFVVKA